VEELYADKANSMKTALMALRERLPEDYSCLTAIYDEIMNSYFSEYSKEMIKQMLNWIQSIYILARYMLCRSHSKHHVFVIKYADVQILIDYFSQKEQVNFQAHIVAD